MRRVSRRRELLEAVDEGDKAMRWLEAVGETWDSSLKCLNLPWSLVLIGFGVAFVEAEETETERLGTDGFKVIFEWPLLELAKEVMRPSSLVIVTPGPRSFKLIGQRHQWETE